MTSGWGSVASAGAVALAGVFAWAGAAKLARPAVTAAAFRGLGVAAPGALARLVPAGELAIAALLLARPRAGGAAALVTLAAFSALLAARLAAGTRAGCGCFGAAGGTTLTAVGLARNALLSALAAACLGAQAWALPTLPAAVAVGAAVAAGAVALALADLRGRVGRLWWVAPLLERGDGR